SMFSDFVKVVSEGRDMSEKEVRKLADGRVYLGNDALENGLVDEIGYDDDALNDLKKEIDVDNPQVYTYGQDLNSLSIIGFKETNMVQKLFTDNDELIAENLLNKRQDRKPMYLYEE